MSPDVRERAAAGRRGEPQEGEGWLAWWRSRGATTQAIVPGTYAWTVTVLPVGMARGASVLTEVATALGIAALVAGPIVERRWKEASRLVSGWGLVGSSIAAWSLAPEAVLGAFDAARGIAGMLGWGLFAFTVAAPARARSFAGLTVTPIEPTPSVTKLDTPVFVLGLVLAVALEVPGWRVAERDRALLLRVVALAGGIGIVTVAGLVAAAFHRVDAPPLRSLSARAIAWLALAVALLGAGAGYRVWRGVL